MLEKLLGVSPPQKGLAQDSKVADKEKLQPDFKKDFERQLQRKLDEKKSTAQKENNKDPKAPKAKKSEDELRAERNEKKPSGGNKKKMVAEAEDKMISNVMALPKSEFEVPDQEINLAMIETDGISETNNDLAAIPKNGIEALQISPELILHEQSLEGAEADGSAILAPGSVSEEALTGDLTKLMQMMQQKQIDRTLEAVTPNEAAPVEAPAVVAPQIEAHATLSAQEQLNEAVGFKSDLKEHVAQAGLVQKMKEFESAKGMSPEVAQSFEQKVLEQLQNEKLVAPAPADTEQKSSSDQQSGTSKEPLQELRTDSLKTETNLHVGQSHTDFKSHMSTPLEKSGSPTAMSQLLERKEENVQEVMRQAQFLATKGGGEMNVKMSPDGMGEIQLKVLMSDGKLNIEMQTQDKSVKKLIEDSLTELRSGLAAQQLQVDHVRISSVDATNTDNSAQFQNQGHGQSSGQAHDQQKDFWKQFQNNFGNQARRGSYGDVQSAGSRNSAEPNAMQPVKLGAARASGRTGSTLNKVA